MKLVKFLQKLNREQVTIELKNGTVIQGTVVGVDATMNCHLKKAKMTVYVLARGQSILFCLALLTSQTLSCRRGKNPVAYATLSVRGSTMRSWILPEALNLDAALVDDTKNRQPPPSQPKPRAGRMMRGGRR